MEGAAIRDRDDSGRRHVIHDAAIQVFSAQGFAATSMAEIAAEAGMSRPALYQYFKNKGDIFQSAFLALFDQTIDRALHALGEGATVQAQLDGCLQRFEGDLYERMAASPFSAEIMQAKHVHVSEQVAVLLERLRAGLSTWLEQVAPGESSAQVAHRASIVDLIRLSPHGFKVDAPTVDIYRSRLSLLARTVAAELS